MALGFGEVHGVEDGPYFIHRKNSRQVGIDLRRCEFVTGVSGWQRSFCVEKAVECLDGAEDARLRTLGHASRDLRLQKAEYVVGRGVGRGDAVGAQQVKILVDVGRLGRDGIG